ncbi:MULTISPECIES: hypothetical protein [Rhizobium/Agrobacterium group]|uniref:hypothetical protein n=1 Tax=Rhizobium/Agrobacterium group TaxID=227290 RepID=UPI00107FCF33|nr:MULTISPECIES: hypothetical protein [Rhizobium/Agrobacterium group]MBB4403142.1 putative TIM-barrel fold metal-dependent hydrolase [Agrobacterium radiobacter]MBB5588948.1 putative TIM-barrel fold metal-dependent hydrolase [Agrobacterium radiobacter]TGE86538.1 hypothetical protein C9418_22745 [Rhizobium sp. SEMIA 4032]
MLTVGQDEIALKPHPPSARKVNIVPKATWDCHAHVVGDPNVFPFIEDRAYTPVAMADDEFLNALDVAGTDFGVLVQISYGTDDRALLQLLQKHRNRLVGVAVISPYD